MQGSLFVKVCYANVVSDRFAGSYVWPLAEGYRYMYLMKVFLYKGLTLHFVILYFNEMDKSGSLKVVLASSSTVACPIGLRAIGAIEPLMPQGVEHQTDALIWFGVSNRRSNL